MVAVRHNCCVYVILTKQVMSFHATSPTFARFGEELQMDVNVKAFRLVQGVTGEAPDQKQQEKRIATRKGGLKGGRARAINLSSQRRVEIARRASEARWKTN